jgi:hypothetical protein
MATFIVEDGTVVAGATSYVTVEELNDYIGIKPNTPTAWEDLDDSVKENYLMWATRLLDQRVRWAGSKADEDSPLRWPRAYVYDRDGYLIDSTVIPSQLKDAVCEVAFFLYNEEADPSAPPSQSGAAAGISKLKADVLEIQYNQSATVTSNTATFHRDLILCSSQLAVCKV